MLYLLTVAFLLQSAYSLVPYCLEKQGIAPRTFYGTPTIAQTGVNLFGGEVCQPGQVCLRRSCVDYSCPETCAAGETCSNAKCRAVPAVLLDGKMPCSTRCGPNEVCVDNFCTLFSELKAPCIGEFCDIPQNSDLCEVLGTMNPEELPTCGDTDVGQCQFGTLMCVDGQIVCEGLVEPTPETEETCANNVDNDCDTLAGCGVDPDCANKAVCQCDYVSGVVPTYISYSQGGGTGDSTGDNNNGDVSDSDTAIGGVDVTQPGDSELEDSSQVDAPVQTNSAKSISGRAVTIDWVAITPTLSLFRAQLLSYFWSQMNPTCYISEEVFTNFTLHYKPANTVLFSVEYSQPSCYFNHVGGTFAFFEEFAEALTQYLDQDVDQSVLTAALVRTEVSYTCQSGPGCVSACPSNQCKSGTCVPQTCFNEQLDGGVGETGVDCGGPCYPCPGTISLGGLCYETADCADQNAVCELGSINAFGATYKICKSP